MASLVSLVDDISELVVLFPPVTSALDIHPCHFFWYVTSGWKSKFATVWLTPTFSLISCLYNATYSLYKFFNQYQCTCVLSSLTNLIASSSLPPDYFFALWFELPLVLLLSIACALLDFIDFVYSSTTLYIYLFTTMFLIGIAVSLCNIKRSLCPSEICVTTHNSWSRNFFDKRAWEQAREWTWRATASSHNCNYKDYCLLGCDAISKFLTDDMASHLRKLQSLHFSVQCVQLFADFTGFCLPTWNKELQHDVTMVTTACTVK